MKVKRYRMVNGKLTITWEEVPPAKPVEPVRQDAGHGDATDRQQAGPHLGQSR